MRITCPGCGSVFDVPDRAVPEPGRDVQCAACGTSWYLLKAAGPGAPAGPADAGSVPTARGATEAVDGSAGSGPDAAPPDPPAQRRVPPEVLAILRAEAETERRARQRAAATSRSGDAGDPLRRGTDEAGSPAADKNRPQDAGPASRFGRNAMTGERGTGSAGDTWAGGRQRASTPGPEAQLGARDRLARLTAAERHPAPTGGEGGLAGRMGTRDGDEDLGLVEDPDAALRDPRPPLLRDPPAVPGRATAMSGNGHLPVPVAVGVQRALVVMQAKRRGFQIGFGATVGICCGALGLYLLALNAGELGGGMVFDAVRSHGAQVQAALVDWLRRVVAPALS